MLKAAQAIFPEPDFRSVKKSGARSDENQGCAALCRVQERKTPPCGRGQAQTLVSSLSSFLSLVVSSACAAWPSRFLRRPYQKVRVWRARGLYPAGESPAG
jgi:hypothetical protein